MKTQCIPMNQKSEKVLSLFGLIMMICLLASPMYAQTNDRTVTGVVSSLDGPLLGATIVLKGTTIAVATNETGAFTFPKKLQENDILVVSYLGYKNKEVTIDRTTTFIEPFLEDIPVVIYGALRTDVAVTPLNSSKL